MIYALIIPALIGLATGGFVTHQIDKAEIQRLQMAIERGNAEADMTLLAAKSKAEKADLLAQQAIKELEKSREQHTQTAVALSGDLDHYRLFPAGDKGCRDAVSSNPSAELSAYAQATAEFSARLDRLIKDKAAAADQLDIDYHAAQQWALRLAPKP